MVKDKITFFFIVVYIFILGLKFYFLVKLFKTAVPYLRGAPPL